MTVKNNNFLSILLLHKLRGLRTREKLLLFEGVESLEDLTTLHQRDVESCICRKLKPGTWNPRDYLGEIERDMAVMKQRGIHSLFIRDPRYPQQLREIYDPPFVLFYRGTLPTFTVPCVGIVGTRFPSCAARSAAFQTGLELSRLGIHVVSGLAKGIDRESHEGSVRGKGISIGVLGNGIDTVYPTSSRKTAEKILEHEGAIFSEYFPGVLPLKYHFPARNRIISGLSRSVVIIQAPSRSGALITADYALEQGRDIYVHRAGLTGTQGAGSRRLYEEGAPVIDYGKEICADWGFHIDLSYLNCHISIEETGMQPGKELAHMLEYELSGRIEMHNGEYY
jgi:DNA processing protein